MVYNTDLQSVIRNLTWEPRAEKPRNCGVVCITHNPEEIASITLAYIKVTVDSRLGCGYQLLPHTLNHCHRSHERLTEKYRWAILEGEGEMAIFMLNVWDTAEKLKACDARLRLDLISTELELKRLKDFPFAEEKEKLNKELTECEQKKKEFIEQYKDDLAARVKWIIKGSKKHEKVEKEFTTQLLYAAEPLVDKQIDIEDRIKALSRKESDVKRLEEVVLVAKLELASHGELAIYLGKMLKDHATESEEEKKAPEKKDPSPSPSTPKHKHSEKVEKLGEDDYNSDELEVLLEIAESESKQKSKLNDAEDTIDPEVMESYLQSLKSEGRAGHTDDYLDSDEEEAYMMSLENQPPAKSATQESDKGKEEL